MSKWKTVRLGDVFELQMGKTPDRKRLDYFKGSHKWISIADISKSEKYISETKESLTDDAISSSGIKIIPKDTVIMSFKLTIGKTAITSNEMYSNEAIMAFLPNKKYETDNSFLYHLFSNKNWSEGSNKAVKGITLNKASLSEMTILLPPLETQKHIAAVLDKCTSLISKYKQILKKYDTLIKSRFIEMFGENPVESGKWKVEKFKNICLLITDGEHTTPQRCTQGIYLLSARNVLNHKLQLDNVDYIDESEYQRIAKRIVPQENDILLSCSGSVGRVCVVPKGLKFQLVRSVALLRLKKDVNPIFMEHLITSDHIQTQIEKSKTQSSQANLFQGKIAELIGFLPPLDLQNDFASFVQQIDKSKFAVQKSLEKVETLYKSLMQEYFG